MWVWYASHVNAMNKTASTRRVAKLPQLVWDEALACALPQQMKAVDQDLREVGSEQHRRVSRNIGTMSSDVPPSSVLWRVFPWAPDAVL
jgi:hypothetical protein